MNFFIFDDYLIKWKQNFWFNFLTGLLLILFALMILFNPIILIAIISAIIIYIGIFLIGSAFMIRKFGKDSELISNWKNSKNWFWKW